MDAQGRTVPNAAGAVTFDVRGPGRLIGVDNGDQNNHDDGYQSRKRTAYNGRDRAVDRDLRHGGGRPRGCPNCASSMWSSAQVDLAPENRHAAGPISPSFATALPQ